MQRVLSAVLALLGVAAATPLAAWQQPDSLAELAEAASRAVVLITTTTSADSRQGSGFLVDSSGRILTNEHVIRGARNLRVKLSSGDVYDAVDILATDDRRDIAVLQIAGFNLPALRLGDSDSVRTGSPVVLIGSPLGLENTVSTGIVSARRQEAEGFQLFQVSAPASRGSSGGPVLALSGRVVGIASSQMQAGQNLNFAVPINYARGLLNHLGDQPLERLRPGPPPDETRTIRLTAEELSVNRGLTFDLGTFAGYSLETETRLDEGRTRRTRITYRVIETLGRAETRLERYLESETTRPTEPFGTRQTVRRERVRTLVDYANLSPLSTRGETVFWTGDGWQTASYDLRFRDGRVQGLVTDSTGRTEELDRDLPPGIILREMRDLAFTAVAEESLVGRSVELATFDPWTGTVMEDRYDVLERTDVDAAGASRPALRVNVTSGLANATAHFGLEGLGLLLRREAGDGTEVEGLVRVTGDPNGG
jgi:hypothetical protein